MNAGYGFHEPQVLNRFMNLVAEDGNLHKYAPRQQYGIQLAPGKTADAALENVEKVSQTITIIPQPFTQGFHKKKRVEIAVGK